MKKKFIKGISKRKKIPAARKFPPPPPHKFSNGPSLTGDGCLREPCFEKRSGLIIFTELIAPYQGKYGFRNPGNFCLWNPKCGKIFLWNQESWALESGTWLQGSGIPLTILIQDLSYTDQESGIQYLESEIHGVESRIVYCLLFCLPKIVQIK